MVPPAVLVSTVSALVSTVSALVVPGATVPTARGPAAICCNALEGLALEASDAAVRQKVCGFLPLPVRCPVLCYHSATQSGHRLASAPVPAWEVPPGLSPAWQATREVLVSPAPVLALAQAASPAPASGVPVAFWWVPVTARAEALVFAVVPPEYGWPLGEAARPCGWDESVVAPARARGGQPIGVCIYVNGMSSWQSILKTLSASCQRPPMTAIPSRQRLLKPYNACLYVRYACRPDTARSGYG